MPDRCYSVSYLVNIQIYACITQSLWSIRSDRYGQCVRSPQNLPQIRSHTVSAYGLHGQLARSLRSRTVARMDGTVARTVSTVGRTVYTASCYGHPERYK